MPAAQERGAAAAACPPQGQRPKVTLLAPARPPLMKPPRVEYPREVVDAMPPGLRLALERSPCRVACAAGNASSAEALVAVQG